MWIACDAFDPNVWSGRAVQEASSTWLMRDFAKLIAEETEKWGKRTDRANECGYRDDHRPDRLPTREQNVSDFDWPAVPVKVAASINA